MKKNVLVFGLISGVIVSGFMVFITTTFCKDPNYSGSMVLGYASMLVAFSFIFIGVKNFRDKYNDGLLTFGKAFQVGALISLVASTMYVITWMIEYTYFFPNFMDVYSEHVLAQAKSSGASPAELEKQMAEMATYKKMYSKPLFVVLLTYAEILPLGLLVALVSGLILKRKARPVAP